MIKLGINNDLITCTEYFLTIQKIQLVIDAHDNKKRKIKAGICQNSLVLPIFILIYISRVFNKVSETSVLVIFLSFVNDLEFIALSSSIKKIVKTLDKVAKTICQLGTLNEVTYNISKTETVLFSKLY